jgi:transposase
MSTYSEGIYIAEWGYNRDHENLRQVNIGMFFSMKSMLPLYYDLYNGSLPDKVCLEYMMTNAKDFGINNICFVFDCGFVTETNFAIMSEIQYPFITSLPTFRSEALKLIDEVKGQMEKSEYRIKASKIYGTVRTFSLYGQIIRAHIYYDPAKKATDSDEIYSQIDKLEEELKKFAKAKISKQRYTNYFKIHEQSHNLFSYEPDKEKIDEKISRAGYFILLEVGLNLSSEEVLKVYRERDSIEKNFDNLKNALDFKRLKTHLNKTTAGKVFIGFIALIIRTYMCNVLKNNKETMKYTFEKILIELNKIYAIKLNDNSELFLPFTKLQKTILSVMKVDIGCIMKT